MRSPAIKEAAPYAALMLVPLLFTADPSALVRVATLATAATGISIVSGMGGQLSLGHAALMGAGALTSAGFATHAGLPVPLSMVLGVLASALLGLAVGLPSLRLRGQYLALATLGAGVIVYRVANELSRFTGGELGLGSVPAATGPLATAFAGMGILAATLYGTAALHRSRFGLRLRAVRDDEAGAAACGVSLLQAKLAAFVLSAAVAGLAGALHAHSEGFVTTLEFDPSRSLALVVAAVLGGLRSPIGGALGALAIAGPAELAPGAFAWLDRYELIVWGPLALLVVFARPDGIAGMLASALPKPKRARLRSGVVRDEPSIEIARSEGVVLSVKGLVKRFGGVVALGGVDLDVRAGTIHALIGPNGSGKTTLVDCATGVHRPDAGEIRVEGIATTSEPAHRVAARGIARTFQNLALFGSLTMRENLLVTGATAAEAEAALRAAGFEQGGHGAAGALSYGERKRLELARVLAASPRLLVLDEPAAGRNEPEIALLAALLEDLRGRGATILLVEHHMGLVQSVADEVTVLDEGRVIAHGTPHEIRSHPDVVEAYLGPVA